MTDFALSQDFAEPRRDEPPPGPPPVNPPWLRPVAVTGIVALHFAVFAAFMFAPALQTISLDSLTMELVQEGDFIEQQEVSAAEDTPPPIAVEQPELALPPPEVMAPDPIPLAMKREDVEKLEKKREERREVARAEQRREAQARRHAGAPNGGASAGASQSSCLAHVAASLRQHTPGSTSLGPGSAHVTFHVNVGGAISGVSASGSTPAHAALARRIVASSRGPGSCGSAYVSQSFAFH